MKLGPFRGWLKTSLAEYPGRVSTVLFTGGCNLRCPYCYNPELARSPDELPSYEAEEALAWIEGRKDLVSAVVVTGGEPTLHPWLGEFLAAVRNLGMATALATNGTYPDSLAELTRRGLLDRVAMDVKTVLEPGAYAVAAGSSEPGLLARVRSSLRILRDSGLDYELRCTAVPRLHTAETLIRLALELQGARHLVFQEFRAGRCLDPDLEGGSPFPPEELERIRAAAERYVERCTIRGSRVETAGA